MRFRAVLATTFLATVATAAMGQSQPSTPAATSPVAAPARQASAAASATAASGGAAYRSAFEGYRRFDDQPVGSWRSANDVVGRIGGWQAYAREGQGKGHDMEAMKNMPSMSMPGMDPNSADAPPAKGSAAGHDMTMADKDAKPVDALSRKNGAAGHDMGLMKNVPGKVMPGMSKPAAGESMGKESHGAMAMGKDDSGGKGRTGPVTGTGVVQGLDKASGKVKLTHDPIAALGWPRMTLFFRLRDNALAEKVKEGDAVDFSLEKSAAGYVISSLDKSPAQRETKKMR